MKFQLTPSPNCNQQEIPVEHLILHYTAVDLESTLKMFQSPGAEVSAHLVIDTDGTIYEMVQCLNGKAWRAWHAGVSRYEEKEAFNDHSIGIEMVNFNGNLFPFTENQYQALQAIVSKLQTLYPALNNPERVLGHEHIAGFRGKADPGCCFDWPRFFADCFPGQPAPERKAVCSDKLLESLLRLKEKEPEGEAYKSRFWQEASGFTEQHASQSDNPDL